MRDIITGTLILTLCCGTAIFFPVFGFIGFLLLPLPVMFYRIKIGRRHGWAVPALALAIVTTLAGGMGPDTWLMMGMLGQGFILGECIERDFAVEKTIALSSGSILLAGFFLITLFGNMSGAGGIELVSEYLRKNLDITVAIYRELDVPEENIRILSDSLDQIHYVLIRIMPSLLASGLVFAAWLNMLLSRTALRKSGIHTPPFERLNTWQAPEWLVWGVIGSALLMILPVSPLKFAGVNVLIILLMIYMFQGFGILSFFFERRKAPLLLRIMIYGIIALQQFLVIPVIGIGFFDMWINFRRLGIGNPEQPST